MAEQDDDGEEQVKEPESRAYVLTLMTISGYVVQIPGLDFAEPRDVVRRVGDMKRRYNELLAERKAAGPKVGSDELFWHEPALEGDDGDGFVVIHDPRLIVSVATATPQVVDVPDDDEEEEEGEDEPEEPKKRPKPFRLGKDKA